MTTFAERLRAETQAVKLKIRRLGTRRRLDEPTEQQAANLWDADVEFISASKRLLNTRDERYRIVTGVQSRAKQYWKSMTVPYPAVKGVRLLRRDNLDAFNAQMCQFREELAGRVVELAEQFGRVMADARQALGSLYRPSDYPSRDELATFFAIEWSFPSVDPPDHLRTLNPRLYEQEQARVRAEMESAVHAAEQAFAAEMQTMVASLCDALTPSSDGVRKQLKPSALTAFSEFFDRFQHTRVGSGGELDDIVKTAQSLLRGVDPSALKQQQEQQQSLFNNFTSIRETLDTLLVDAPTRSIQLGEDDE